MLDKFLLLFARFVEATERQAKATEGLVLLQMAQAGVKGTEVGTVTEGGEAPNLEDGPALTAIAEQQAINDEIAQKTAAAEAQKKLDAANATKKTDEAKKKAELEKKQKAELEAKAKAEAALEADLAGGDAPRKVSVDDVRSALRDYSKLEGTDAAIALLTRFAAKSVSDLSDEDRVKCVDIINGVDVE